MVERTKQEQAWVGDAVLALWARQWILESNVDLSLLLSGERTLEDVESTFKDLEAGNGIKYVIRP